MDKFIETCNLQRLRWQELKNLNGLISSKELESLIEKVPTNKSVGSDGFTGEFYQTFKGEVIRILKVFQNN